MRNNEKIKSAIAGLLDLFRSGEIPEKVALVTNPGLDVPSQKWSLNNRLIQLVHGTFDSRGFRQWEQVDRKVKKGVKALYILAPRTFEQYRCECGTTLYTKDLQDRKCLRCGRDVDEENIIRAITFTGIPVFRVEDTEGKALPYTSIPIPQHSFLKVAEAWKISVQTCPFAGDVYGYYERGQKIVLASPEEDVFYHELAHAAHHRLGLIRKECQDPANEIVAEFSAAVLSSMQGKKAKLGNSYEYLEHYAKLQKMSVERAVLHLLAEIEVVVKLILETDEKESLPSGGINVHKNR